MSTEAKPRAGFFRTFFGTCAGTGIFDVLVQHSLFRTLRHLLLLVLFCALGVTAAQSTKIRAAIERKRQCFIQEFGPFSATEPQRPTREPERARKLDLGFLLIDYRPELPKELPAVDEIPLLLWSPRCPVLLWRNGSQLLALLPEEDGELQLLNPEQSGKFREELSEIKEKDTREVLRKLDLPHLFSLEHLSTAYQIAFFLVFGLTALLLALILCAMLALIYGLTGMRTQRIIRPGEMFRIAVYAGFPAMAVASLFPAFDLPLLHFESAYAIGLSLYMLAVTASVDSRRRNSLRPTQEDQKNG